MAKSLRIRASAWLLAGTCSPAAVLLSLSVAIELSGCGFRSSGGSGAPDVTVASVTDLGTIPTNPDILGRDVAYSALFQGYSVWIYGDTFIANPDAQGFGLLSDSWSYTKDLDAQNGIAGFRERLDSAGAPTMILPETAYEQAFNAAHNVNHCLQQPCGARWALWPASIVTDPVSGNAMIFYQLVYAVPGNFNFQGIGNSVAIWSSFQNQPQRPTFNPPIVDGHPDLMFNQNQPSFGATALIADGTVYAYGCGLHTFGLDKGCRLGRVDPGKVQDIAAWTYYAGDGLWSSRMDDAISVFSGDDILSVAWNGYLKKYVAIYSTPFSQDVMLRTALRPEGPWSDERKLFTAEQPASGNVYDAHAHPEYDRNGGQTIYVTYSRATAQLFTSEVRLVQVTLQARNAPR